MNMKFLVTGAAGFIGMNTCLKLLNNNHSVIGIDNVNNYYMLQIDDLQYDLMNCEQYDVPRTI